MKFFKWLKTKLVKVLKSTWKQLKDRTNIVIYIIVNIVISSEVWIPYLLAIITGNKWWWGIGSACWAFWLAPFTPFTVICVALTFGIRKLYDKLKAKRKNKKETKDNDSTSSKSKSKPADKGREPVSGTESESTGESETLPPG